MKSLAFNLATGLALSAIAHAQESKPNIILFFVDDMGWQDTSVPFTEKPTPWNRLYRTPHMLDLARRGAKFTQAYAAHPVCSPTRSSMMTGKNPARTHVDDWVGHGYTKNSYLRSPKWAATGLQPTGPHITLPTILASNGYRTIHVGKAHFGGKGTPGADPTTLGFDINIAGSHTGGPWGGWISPWLGKHKDVYPNLGDRPKGEYLTRAITVKAVECIDDAIRDKTPFFMNMAQFAVHTGLAPAPDYIDGYQDGRPKVEADYASMLEAMDASLGSILAKLRDPNGDGNTDDSIANNTLVIFTSDNGGLSNHTRAKVGKVRVRPTSGKVIDADFERDWHNRPLKSGKGSAYEGGIRVPMLVAWAGQQPDALPVRASLPIKPGSTITEPVHMDDFFATAVHVAGIDNPVAKNERDGQTLVPLLSGRAFERRAPLFWHYPHQWYRDVGTGLGIEPFSAMRKGRYKVIYFYGDGVVDGEGYDPRVELYDLSVDLGEERNLATNEPILCMALRDQLVAWLAQVGAGIPIVKATNKPVALPKPGRPLHD
ncbi:MAG: arylsulfatase A-like enzyme [Planctomycetota bacterium]|jgi:arylsulfatase A-like enzyme